MAVLHGTVTETNFEKRKFEQIREGPPVAAEGPLLFLERVIAGLDPAIQAALQRALCTVRTHSILSMDARVKPAHERKSSRLLAAL